MEEYDVEVLGGARVTKVCTKAGGEGVVRRRGVRQEGIRGYGVRREGRGYEGEEGGGGGLVLVTGKGLMGEVGGRR